MIPDEAVEAALAAKLQPDYWMLLDDKAKVRHILEAALPTLLSHEREETRLAHIDAVVNAKAVDRLERELDTAKADAWDEGADAECYSGTHELPVNPYRITK